MKAQLDLLVLPGLLAVGLGWPQSGAAFALALFVWAFCLPYALSCLVLQSARPPRSGRVFLFTLSLYTAWLLLAAAFALGFRQDSAVLGNALQVAPALLLALFVLLRADNADAWLLLCNASIFWALPVALYAVYRRGFAADSQLHGCALALLPAAILVSLRLYAEARGGWPIRVRTVAVTAVLWAGMLAAQAAETAICTVAAMLFVLSPLGRTRSFGIKFGFVVLLVLGLALVGNFWADDGPAGAPAGGISPADIWLAVWRGMTSNPYIVLFGGGTSSLGQWGEAVTGWAMTDTHNAWLDHVVMFGVPGLVLYLAVWWRFFQLAEQHIPAQTGFLQSCCRAILLASMASYFFEPAANDMASVCQAVLFMSIGLLTRSVPAAASRHATLRRAAPGSAAVQPAGFRRFSQIR